MLLDFVLKLKGYPLEKARQTLHQIQLMEPEALIQWQEKKRWEAARYHYENNKTYHLLFAGKFPDNWESLPVVQKNNLQGKLDDLISAPFKRGELHLGSTSGSSGHPFYYVKDKFAHAMTYALIADRYAWYGLSLRQKQARFYGIPLAGKSRWIEQAKDLIANRVRFPVFDLSDAQLHIFLKKFATVKFRYIYGYTSALVLFARFLTNQYTTLKQVCPTLCAGIVTSEVCTKEDKSLLETAFGIPIINEYGASELDTIAFTDKIGDWILSTENLFIEILDEQHRPLPDGQEGRVVITSLHNRAFPMVRYEIGDIGSVERGAKSRLLQLSGRTNDVIELPSGKKAAGLTFYYISRSILESGGALKEFVIKQTALNAFVFEVVSARPLTIEAEKGIRQAMKDYLEDGLTFTIRYVDSIDRPGAGKIKHFYAQISSGQC